MSFFFFFSGNWSVIHKSQTFNSHSAIIRLSFNIYHVNVNHTFYHKVTVNLLIHISCPSNLDKTMWHFGGAKIWSLCNCQHVDNICCIPYTLFVSISHRFPFLCTFLSGSLPHLPLATERSINKKEGNNRL